MKNAGWILSGVLVAVFALVAAAPAGDDHIVQKLEEIKAITTESLRLQKIDMHRRLFPAHKLVEKCDLDSGCAGIDAVVKAHVRAWAHPWSETCGAGKCAGKEETYQKNLKASEDR